MNEEQIKKRLQREIRTLDFELLWKWLVEDQYVAMLRNEELGWQEFKEEAKRLAERQREVSQIEAVRYTGPRPGRSGGQPVEVELDPDESRLRDTYSRYLTLVGERHPGVVWFRERALKGKLLSTDEARVFINSPATACFRLEDFEEWSIPLVGHTSEIWGVEWADNETLDRRLTIRIVSPGHDAPVRKHLILHDGEQHLAEDTVKRLLERGYTLGARTKRTSVLDDLLKVSDSLVGSLNIAEVEATNFILTGEWPKLSTVTAWIGWGDDKNITITADSWVSSETIRKLYRQLQHQIRGGDNRPLSEKSLAVFLFVTEVCADLYYSGGEKPSWNELLARWNERHPNSSYKDRSGLFKAYESVQKVLVSKATVPYEGKERASSAHQLLYRYAANVREQRRRRHVRTRPQ